MPAPKAPLLPTAKPKHSALFDLFNSSSTGHQRAENKAGSPTGWRLSRTTKLTVQFCDGAPSGKQKDSNSGGSQVESSTILNNKYNPPPSTDSVSQRLFAGDVDCKSTTFLAQYPPHTILVSSQNLSGPKGIFNGLVIYINGSTYPLISDHKLKHLLAQNGAKVSIHLSRKQVTHVIVGTPSNQKSSSGAGGGLAAGKTQKEISRVGGCGIKYVGVEW